MQASEVSRSPGNKAMLRRVLGGARVAWGVATLIYPRANMGLLGLPSGDNADYSYMSRLFATREMTLGALSSGLVGNEVAAAAGRAGVAIDAVDVMSLWLSRKEGRAKTGPLIALTALGLAAIGAGYLTLED